MTKLVKEMLIYGVFYFAQLFLFGIVGFVLFSDISEFNTLKTALFTLFTATIKDYDIYMMSNARVGAFIGYVYFLAFLILNLILIVNLIVGQMSYAYKQYSKRRGILFLLETLSVREVSEADEKYSAVISTPFPLSMLNFIFAGVIFGSKSISLNVFFLNIYYLPIFLVILVLFIAY
jgi:hypothetical protein